MQGKVEGIMDRGGPKKDRMDNITQWTYKTIDELLRKDSDGRRRYVIVAIEMSHPTCNRLRGRGKSPITDP